MVRTRDDAVPVGFARFTITSAQGLIDNGGLRAFFETDWPGTPPYSTFTDAYERIGCTDGAETIRQAADSFGLECPEICREKRIVFIEQNYDEATFCVRGWQDTLCGDEAVWSQLASWAREMVRD